MFLFRLVKVPEEPPSIKYVAACFVYHLILFVRFVV